MKKTIVILTLAILILGCFNFVACTKNDADIEETTEDAEFSRVKRILEIEFSNLHPFISMECSLTYHSCTFYTVEKTGKDGYLVSGKILYTDQFGDKYYENYSAYVENGSWLPEIQRSEVKKMNE